MAVFIELHRTDRDPRASVWVNPDHVLRVEPDASTGATGPVTRSHVTMIDGEGLTVDGPPAQVAATLSNARTKN
ncbi:MAG: hypothetical protein K2R98_28915 [Gemmataceae bacterium]|nr:hypothetical protein [Gemmataceae bacterium]